MTRGVWITLVIVGGFIIISESVIVAVKPESASSIVQDASVLASIATTAIISLRNQNKVLKKSDETTELLEQVRTNVNGNLSELIEFAKQMGYPTERLDALQEKRAKMMETGHKPDHSLYT